MKKYSILLTCLALFATVTLAQSTESVTPACGAEGDKVLIRGEAFGEDPSVTVGGEDAKVLGSRDDKILIRVPDGLEAGEATIAVDGTDLDADFTVVEDGTPVIQRMSVDTATPGTRILLIGLRLRDVEAEFVNDADEVVATAEVKGYYRFALLKVPDDLAVDTYRLRLVNDDNQDTDPCSPSIEIVDEADPELDSIQPEGQLPGHSVTINGSNLGPLGLVVVTWTDSSDETLESAGLSNGFDKIFTRVPVKAEAGATYDVAVEIDDTTTTSIEYEVGSPPAPTLDELSPDAGPAGSHFKITGDGLFVLGSKPTVEMDDGTEKIEAKVLFGVPGFGDHKDTLFVVVPEDAADGEYDVTVTVGSQTSEALTYTVEDRELTVTSLKPDTQKRFRFPVKIAGTGFGSWKGDPIEVTWDDEKGRVLFRTDTILIVWPPKLDEGTYDVTVTLNPGEDDETSADVGTYTVE